MDYLFCAIAAIIGIFVGICIGVVISNSKTKKRSMGRLRIDHSEPDEPARLFLELKGVTPDMISGYKVVTFEVINENYISRD